MLVPQQETDHAERGRSPEQEHPLHKVRARPVDLHAEIGKAALRNGLLVRSDVHMVTFAPPLVVEEADLVTMVEILARSAREVLREV